MVLAQKICLLHFAFSGVDGTLFGKYKANIKEEDTPFTGLLNELFGLPHGELVLQHHVAEA